MAIREYKTDFLVVGAGAAGPMLGYLLEQAGCDVLLLELQDAREKDKLCGGLLGETALERIEEVYGKAALDELAPFPLRRLVRRMLDKKLVTDCSFAALPRKRLDDWLLARYLEIGGTLLDRVRIKAIDIEAHLATVTDLRTQDILHIGYGAIIGADGAASAVRRILCGRKQRTVPSIQADQKPCGDEVIFDIMHSNPGYCWYIPAGESANIGCGAYGVNAKKLRAWLAGFCDEYGFEPSALRGAPIPTGDDIVLAPARDAWLVGDAAGLISPSTSGGIHHAFSSACLLASSFLGGPSYEDVMRATVEQIEEEARCIDMVYFHTVLAIAQNGELF